MKIGDIMSRDVMLASPDMSLEEAARMMRDGDTGFLPVGENDRLIGAITDRDIVIRAVAEGRNPASTRVREALTEKVVWCYDDEDATKVAQMMEEKQIRRLSIVNHDKRLVGVVSIGDLAVKLRRDEVAGHTLEGISRSTGSWSHH